MVGGGVFIPEVRVRFALGSPLWYILAMPYLSMEQRREYQRQWVAQNRAAWLAGKTCAVCGSDQNLEVDHADPTSKLSHRVWSWSKARREAELAKCQVLCRGCHQSKTVEHLDGSYKVPPEAVVEIRQRHKEGWSMRRLARRFNVACSHIHRLVHGLQRTDVPFI